MDDPLDLHQKLLSRLESLSKRILERKMGTVQDVWQFEIDLMKFQIEQQRAINLEQKHRKDVNVRLKEILHTKQADWKVQRQQYQEELEQNKLLVQMYSLAIDIARKLGDTLVWIFLDRVQVVARSRDASMPSSEVHRIPEGHGLQGMLAIAEILCNAGAGLPILHDITHCLRIGDITFYAPNNNPLTIEVKTKLKGYNEDKMILAVKTHSILTAAEDKRLEAVYTHIPKELSLPQNIDDYQIAHVSDVIEEELMRQLEKLDRITAWQSAKDGESFQLGERIIGISSYIHSDEDMHHYDAIQEFVQEAKAQNFACRAVDNAFVYTAFYRDTPLWLLEGLQAIPEKSIPDYQQTNLSIVFPEPEKNIALVFNVFNNPSFVHPIFMYPLPPEIIIDLMWQRMQIYVTINIGKLVDALQAVNIDARLPKNEQELDKRSIPVFMEISLLNGQNIYGQFKGIQHYTAQIVHEFLSLQGFVELISHTIAMTTEQAKKTLNGKLDLKPGVDWKKKKGEKPRS